ncbi:MAG: DUF3098 domain-containing protein [Porphyromonas sp.]|nr:DUF3098 domain-containing protein [Porphyromonas sp.]
MKGKGKPIEEQSFRTYGYSRTNLLILVVSLVVIALGYLLMSGGASSDMSEFDPEVFSTRRITVAPMICTLGYLGVVVAILFRKK